MPHADGRLFAADIAARMGIKPVTWRAYVSRKVVPQPIDRVVVAGNARPVWDPQVIEQFLAKRTGRPGPRPRPRERTTEETEAADAV